MNIITPLKRPLTVDEESMANELNDDPTISIRQMCRKYTTVDVTVRKVLITKFGYSGLLKVIDNNFQSKSVPEKVYDQDALLKEVIHMTRRGITLQVIENHIGHTPFLRYSFLNVYNYIARIRVKMIAECWYSGRSLKWINDNFYKTSDTFLTPKKFHGLRLSYPDVFFLNLFDSEPIDV